MDSDSAELPQLDWTLLLCGQKGGPEQILTGLQTLSIVSQQLKKIILSPEHYYRYIFPSFEQKGLESFYGEDRSFCSGQIFDTSDFIIEFQFNANRKLWPIAHHHNSFRGSLRQQEIQITGLYYLNPPIDFNCDQFVDGLKLIVSQVPAKTFLYEVHSYPDAQSAEIKQISQKIR